MILECRIWMGSCESQDPLTAVGSDNPNRWRLTGWGREEDRVRTQAAGIDLHWVKPVDPHALRRILALEPAKRA